MHPRRVQFLASLWPSQLIVTFVIGTAGDLIKGVLHPVNRALDTSLGKASNDGAAIRELIVTSLAHREVRFSDP